MITFGLRLTVRGGREAAARLIVICAAVAIGVGLLLSTLASLSAVHAQNNRFAWIETGGGLPTDVAPTTAGTDPVWWLLTADEFAGKIIGRVDVAATGPRSPLPPGLSRLPAAGEYFASPAMAKLLRRTPADQLSVRYPGHLAGTIGSAGLPSPDALLVVVGRPVAALSNQSRASLVSQISTTPPDQCDNACFEVGLNAHSIDLILSVVTAAILFPVLIFIGSATRLSAVRREQRFAAMRLVGATPRQIAVVSTVESTVAAVIGVVLGFGVFAAFRPLLADVPFTGSRFFPQDLSLSLVDIVAVAVGVPVAAAIVARLALRRVIYAPLGVSRRVTPPAPRAWRLLVPAAGLAELAYFAHAGRPATITGQIWAFLIGILVTMVGLVFAGPWLTMVGSRLLAARARRPAALIAARRLGDNPQAGFRAISGLVLSLFVATIAFGIIITFEGNRGGPTSNTTADRSTLDDTLIDFDRDTPTAPVSALPAGMTSTLMRISGVEGVAALHAPADFANTRGPFQFLISCADLAHTPALGRCPAGAAAVEIQDPNFFDGSRDQASIVWPAASQAPSAIAQLPVATIVISTDGTRGAIEAARSVLEVVPGVGSARTFAPATITENRNSGADTQRAQGYRRLADIVILTSLPIAGCTLAVSIVGGLNDRRRPFSLLRLTGAPLSVLRRVVALEAAVPLLLGAVVSTGVGFLSAYLFLRAQLSETLLPPGLEYYGTVAAGILASLAIIASTMPLLRRTTGPETARND